MLPQMMPLPWVMIFFFLSVSFLMISFLLSMIYLSFSGKSGNFIRFSSLDMPW